MISILPQFRDFIFSPIFANDLGKRRRKSFFEKGGNRCDDHARRFAISALTPATS
jgi:hypothetical protein